MSEEPEHRTPNVHQKRAATQRAREQRREQVGRALLERRTYRDIATEHGVGVATIANDVQVIRRGWVERAGLNYDEAVGEELAKLDALEWAYFPAALTGDKLAAALVLKVAERRAKLRGLDQPAKATLTVELPDLEAKKARAAEMIDELSRWRDRRPG